MIEKGERKSGQLTVKLRDDEGVPLRARSTILIHENLPIGGGKYRLDREKDDIVSTDLPPGVYTVQVAVRGYAVEGGLAKIQLEETTELEFCLVPAVKVSRPTLGDRLKTYGLSLKKLNLRALEIKPEQTVRLDFRKHKNPRDFTLLRARSIRDVRKWLGGPAGVFRHAEPRLGLLPDVAELPKEVSKSAGIVGEHRIALAKLAEEYIYGNINTVAEYEPLLDGAFQMQFAAGMPVAVFHYKVVTINAGSRLEVGDGSSVFVADRLRIHKQGILAPVSTVRIDVGVYEEFE